MNFFKHFSDSHEGRSIMALMDKFGHAGYATYFILLEICVGKIQKTKDEELTEEHCKFVINDRLIRSKCRLGATNVERILDFCAELNLFAAVKENQEWHFSIPKLLEYMDRDSKRARTERGKGAAGPGQDKDKDKDKDTPGKVGAPVPPSVDPSEVIGLWNTVCQPRGLPKVRMTDGRARKIKARAKQLGTVDQWRELFLRVVSSPFLLGDNDRKWRADIDWLIDSETNAAKVLEGKYDRAQAIQARSPTGAQAAYDAMMGGRNA